VVLAVAPGNFLDGDGFAAPAIHTTHGIHKKNEKPPQRNELEAPYGELVIAGRRLIPARTDGGRTHTRSYGHFDGFLSALKWACW